MASILHNIWGLNRVTACAGNSLSSAIGAGKISERDYSSYSGHRTQASAEGVLLGYQQEDAERVP